MCVCVCGHKCVRVFLHFCGTKGVVWFPHWCIVGIDGLREGVGCRDKPLNFELERQAAAGRETGEEQEELTEPADDYSSLFRTRVASWGDGCNFFFSLFPYLLCHDFSCEVAFDCPDEGFVTGRLKVK